VFSRKYKASLFISLGKLDNKNCKNILSDVIRLDSSDSTLFTVRFVKRVTLSSDLDPTEMAATTGGLT
jgi:hypothetical protein